MRELGALIAARLARRYQPSTPASQATISIPKGPSARRLVSDYSRERARRFLEAGVSGAGIQSSGKRGRKGAIGLVTVRVQVVTFDTAHRHVRVAPLSRRLPPIDPTGNPSNYGHYATRPDHRRSAEPADFPWNYTGG